MVIIDYTGGQLRHIAYMPWSYSSLALGLLTASLPFKHSLLRESLLQEGRAFSKSSPKLQELGAERWENGVTRTEGVSEWPYKLCHF